MNGEELSADFLSCLCGRELVSISLKASCIAVYRRISDFYPSPE